MSKLDEVSPEELAENFELLEEWEARYGYIIELGRELPEMPESAKTEENKVRGCQSQVWLIYKLAGEPAHLEFLADSDAHIVRGLIAILFIVYNHRSPREIADFDIEAYFEKLHLYQHLSPSRSNGLHSMIQRIGAIAGAYLADRAN